MPLNSTVAREQWQRYTYCRDTGHLLYIDKARKCEEFFAGIQWDANDLNALREQRRPALTINKILGTLSTILGEQINLRSEIAYKARFGAPSGNADLLTKTFNFISDQNQLDWVRSDVFCDGAITSRGFFDVRMNFDRSVTGDVEITNLNPKNVIPDPDAYEYDPDKWNDVIITRWMTADDIEYMYNKEDADALREKSSSVFAYGYDSIDRTRDRFAGSGPMGLYVTDDIKATARAIRVIERQHKKLSKMKYFIDIKRGDRQLVPFTWDRDRIAQALSVAQGQLVVDEQVGHRIRWTVTADDYVLFDEWSPYKHYTVVPYFPYFRYGRTIGLVENLIDPQELLNKTTSQELHVVNTMANSGWKIKRGSLGNMTPDELEAHGARTGLVLELDDVKDAEKIQPNQIPAGLDRLSVKGENYIKAVSMRGDAQTGMARADVSADQIEAQRASSDVGLQKPLDNLNRTDWLLARNVRDLVQEYYTDPRIMSISKNDLTGEQEEININWPDAETGEIINDVTLGEYDITVISQPARQSLEQSQFEQGVMLREKLGVQIPDEFLIENSNLLNKTALVKALKEAKESPEAKMQQEVQTLSAQLEVARAKEEAARLSADAVLKRAKAAKEIAATQEITDGDGGEQAEMAIEQHKFEQEMQMKREAHDQEMQMKREKHAMDLQLAQQKAEDDARLKRAQAIMAARQQQTKPQEGAKAA